MSPLQNLKNSVSGKVDAAKSAVNERVDAVKGTVEQKHNAFIAWHMTPMQKALLIVVVVLASMIIGYKQWVDLDAEIAAEHGAKVAPPTFSEQLAEQVSEVGGMVRRKAVDIAGEQAVARTERKLGYLGKKAKQGISRTAEAAGEAAASAFDTAVSGATVAADVASVAAVETGTRAKDFAVATKDKAVVTVQGLRDEYQRKKDAEKAAVERKEQERAEQERRRELTAQTNKSIDAANGKFMKNDLPGADELFRSAVETAQTGEQQYRAWRGVALIASLQKRGKDEKIAGQEMLELSVNDKDKANAHAAIADGEFHMGNFSAAISGHRKSAACHNADGNIRMAWTSLAEAAKIARVSAGDFKSSAGIIKQAWDLVENSPLDDFSKREAKWNLCLDYADNARLQGDRASQVKWNREACEYNPAWKQTADMIERELRDKGLL